MGNSEPVYLKEQRNQTAYDSLTRVNAVLSRYNQLDVNTISGSGQEELICIRHSILALLLKEPCSVSEIKSLQLSLNQQISESIYDKKDRQEISDICTRDWKNKLLPKLLKLCTESLKFKLKDHLPTGVLVDLGFALEAYSRRPERWQDFLIYKIAPVLLAANISSESRTRALNVIYTEFNILSKVFSV